MATANLNANTPPLQYRIGETDRTIGGATAAPNGFSVLNLTNGKIFVAQSAVWTDGGTITAPNVANPFDFQQLLGQWYATNYTNLTTANLKPALKEDTSGNITGGAGYRIGTSDRTVGSTANAPEGFVVLNTTNNKVYQVQSGLWQSITTFPSDLQTAWDEA